jgi:hypothetical protein
MNQVPRPVKGYRFEIPMRHSTASNIGWLHDTGSRSPDGERGLVHNDARSHDHDQRNRVVDPPRLRRERSASDPTGASPSPAATTPVHPRTNSEPDQQQTAHTLDP